MAEPFKSRVNTNVVPLAQRVEGPGIGRGLTALGDALGNVAAREAQGEEQARQVDAQLAELEQRRTRSAAIATGMGAWADAQIGIADELEQLSKSATAPDYETKAEAVIANRIAAFEATLSPDSEVRQRFAPSIAEARVRLAGSVRTTGAGARANMQSEGLEVWQKFTVNQLQSDPSPQRYDTFVKSVDLFVDGLDADDARKADAKGKLLRSGARGLLTGLIDKGAYQGAAALLDKGFFDAVLTPEDKTAFGGQIKGAASAAASAAEAGVKQRQDDATDALATLEATWDGGGTASADQVANAAAAARAAGVDEARVIKFENAARTAGFNSFYGPAADPSGARTRARREQLVAVRRARAFTSDESREFAQLDRLTGVRRSAAADGLRPLLAKGAQGRGEALAEIDAGPKADRFATAEALERGLGYFGALAPRTRTEALAGQAELSANPDLIKVKQVLKNGQQGTALVDPTRAAFRAAIGPMAGVLGEGAINGYRDVANGLYAKMLKDTGRSGWQPELYRRATNLALGAQRDPASGEWFGGMGLVGGRHVMLPDWASARMVETQLARFDYANARDGNGQRPGKAAILRDFTPVLVGGGDAGEAAVYELIDANGRRLNAAGGGAYRITYAPPGR